MKAFHLITAVTLLLPAVARAQEAKDTNKDFDHPVAPVKNAFEISVATGYSQGGGNLGGGMQNLQDVSGPGGVVEIGAGYRIIPELSLGLYGTLSKYDNGDDIANSTDVLGATAGVQAAWHFRPDRSIDPWVSLGTGWKGLWLDPDQGKSTSLQGLELARVQVGADYRVSKDIAIAPVVGGSLGMFLSQDSPMTTDFNEIDDKQVNFTGFAGLSGRFDLGGERGKI